MKKSLLIIIFLFLIMSASSCSYFDFFVEPTDAEISQETASLEAEQSPQLTLAASEDKAAIESFGLAYSPNASFNPITTSNAANQNLAPLMYEGLFTINPDFETESLLCKSYTVTSDLRTYTFTLQQGVCFSDGTALTADDVVYSLTQARWHENSVYSARFHAFSSITAIDSETVEVVMDVPYEDLPLILDIPIIKDGSINDNMPLGTGPYVMRRSSQGSYLEPNTYWSKTVPITRIYLYEAESVEDITNSFQTEEITLVTTDPTGISPLTFHNDYEFWNFGTSIMQYVGFNVTREVFAKKAARVAVSYIIDREGIVADIYNGLAIASALPARPGSKLYNESLAASYAYDPEKFNKVLEDAEYREMTELYNDGFLYFYNGQYMAPCSIIFIVNSENNLKVQAATEIAEKLREYKFKVDLRVLSYEDYMSALRKGEFDMFYGEVKMTADFDLYNLLGTRGYISYGDIYSSDLDQKVYTALENSGAAYDVYEYILDEGLLVPILFKDYAVVTIRGSVTGVDPTVWNSFYGIDNWKVSLK